MFLNKKILCLVIFKFWGGLEVYLRVVPCLRMIERNICGHDILLGGLGKFAAFYSKMSSTELY